LSLILFQISESKAKQKARQNFKLSSQCHEWMLSDMAILCAISGGAESK
jgi:hypothetical protein